MKKLIYSIIGLLVLGLIVFIIVSPGKPGKYDSFAQCIKDKGAIFYGTFWCPHCQAQKARFGKSVKFLPYTECSTPDGQGQTPVCKDANVTSYPTWKFADGTLHVGEMELVDLASTTGCVLPQ